MVYVMGIDGGGTKTAAVIADEYGHIYAQTFVGKSNPTTMTREQYEAVIIECLENLKVQNEEVFLQVECCFAGLSGVVETNLEEFTEKIFRIYYGESIPVIIENDAYVALYSGTLGKPGVVQIAGTGAITFGIDPQNKKVRSGGYGYLMDDEGSGYYLGIKALNAVVKAYDLRGEPTQLTNKILNHFKVEKAIQLIDKIHTKQHPRTIIAPLSFYVTEAAIAGDKIAINIIEEACEKIVDAIQACLKQTFWGKGTIPVVLVGGVFTEFDFFKQEILKISSRRQLHVELVRPKLEPVGGAVIGGLKQLGVAPTFNYIQTFIETLDAV